MKYYFLTTFLVLMFLLEPLGLAVEFDKPQMIKYQYLFDKYACENILDNQTNLKINAIFNPYKDFLREHLLKSPEEVNLAGYSLQRLIFDQDLREKLYERGKEDLPSFKSLLFENTYKKLPDWSQHWTLLETWSRRSWIGENDQLDGWIFKIFSYESNMSSAANVLRVPMAHLMANIINEKNLHDLVVPKKCLVQVYDREIIDQLSEDYVSLGFIDVVEKLDLLDEKETIPYLSKLPELKQQNIAEQVATLVTYSGLWDVTFSNIRITKDGKLAFIDTEPLRGELLLDEDLPHAAGAKENYSDDARSMRLRKIRTLRVSAGMALKQLRASAENLDLMTFVKTIDSFLERLPNLK